MKRGTGSFLDEIALGRYIQGTSPLHLAKTKPKALLFSFAAVSAFFFQSATSFICLGLVTALLSIKARLPQRLFWRSLRPINLLALFTILAGAFLNHSQASTLDPAFSWTGLHSGGLYAGRLVLITLLTTIFLLTTKPQRAIEFGITLLKPLKWIGIDQQELSLLVHLAYRFVPLLRREIREVRVGRKARNLPPSRGVLGKAKSSLDTLVFIFVGALRRAETTSFALEQRRVVESWQSSVAPEQGGLGGWMTGLLVITTALLLYGDRYFL